MSNHSKIKLRHRQFLNFLLAIIVGSGILLNCSKESADTASITPDSVFITAGRKVTSSTFDSLRSTLLEAMGKEGAESAVTFCNLNALGITQHLADTFSIRRTALRYRNAANRPDSLELSIFYQMTDDMQGVKIPIDRLVRSQESIHYFRPIMMQGMCLSCHGKPGDQIAPSTHARINQLYPKDKATDFKEGDLRGLWHVIFKVSAQK